MRGEGGGLAEIGAGGAESCTRRRRSEARSTSRWWRACAENLRRHRPISVSCMRSELPSEVRPQTGRTSVSMVAWESE